LEQEAEEHGFVIHLPELLSFQEKRFSQSNWNRLVLATLTETFAVEPDCKCFRLIGGVLVERTVKDVVLALQTNREGVSYLGRLLSRYLAHPVVEDPESYIGSS
jgi:hypothetical protein